MDLPVAAVARRWGASSAARTAEVAARTTGRYCASAGRVVGDAAKGVTGEPSAAQNPEDARIAVPARARGSVTHSAPRVTTETGAPGGGFIVPRRTARRRLPTRRHRPVHVAPLFFPQNFDAEEANIAIAALQADATVASHPGVVAPTGEHRTGVVRTRGADIVRQTLPECDRRGQTNVTSASVGQTGQRGKGTRGEIVATAKRIGAGLRSRGLGAMMIARCAIDALKMAREQDDTTPMARSSPADPDCAISTPAGGRDQALSKGAPLRRKGRGRRLRRPQPTSATTGGTGPLGTSGPSATPPGVQHAHEPSAVLRDRDTSADTAMGRTKVPCAGVAQTEGGLRVIIDSGCGEHIMSEADAARHGFNWTDRSADGRRFEGVGKTSTVRWTVQCDLPELEEAPDFWVMKSSPALMSIGLRCMERGYTYVWPRGRPPYFISPGGYKITGVVDGNIPYHIVGDPRCQPCPITDEDLVVPPPETLTVPWLPAAIDSGWTQDRHAAVQGMPLYCAKAMHGAPARRDLGSESTALAHLLTHMPANPHCEACIRAKMREPPHRGGAYDRKPKVWGEIITCDHLVQRDTDVSVGITGDKDALTVRDLYSRYLWCYPMKSRSQENTEEALRDFAGGYKISRVYGDNSLEIKGACRQLGWPHEGAQVGVPQSNGIIERANGIVLAMTRTALVASGLPNNFWPYATRCVCFNYNTDWTKGEGSPWFKAHNKEIDGHRLPFGCLVWFLRSNPKGKKDEKRTPKWGGRATAGIFAGYVTSPGCGWTGRYLAWELDSFAHLDLRADSSGRAKGVGTPHDTARIFLPKGEVFFPCKKRYDKINATLEGVQIGLGINTDDEDIPPIGAADPAGAPVDGDDPSAPLDGSGGSAGEAVEGPAREPSAVPGGGDLVEGPSLSPEHISAPSAAQGGGDTVEGARGGSSSSAAGSGGPDVIVSVADAVDEDIASAMSSISAGIPDDDIERHETERSDEVDAAEALADPPGAPAGPVAPEHTDDLPRPIVGPAVVVPGHPWALTRVPLEREDGAGQSIGEDAEQGGPGMRESSAAHPGRPSSPPGLLPPIPEAPEAEADGGRDAADDGADAGADVGRRYGPPTRWTEFPVPLAEREFPHVDRIDGLNPTERPPGGFVPGDIFVDIDGVLKTQLAGRAVNCDESGQKMERRTLARPPSLDIHVWKALKMTKDREAAWTRYFDGTDTALPLSVWRAELPTGALLAAAAPITRTTWFVDAVDHEQNYMAAVAAAGRPAGAADSQRVPSAAPGGPAGEPGGQREPSAARDGSTPAMPTTPTRYGHRERMARPVPLFAACVARPVGRKELEATPKAQAAVRKEWDKLIAKGVWDMATVQEWGSVAARARRCGETVHHGSLATIVVEKNSELDEGDPARVFKGRTVFLGDQVHDQNWESAVFQDIGSSPATIEASRVADCYGLAPGHDITTADGEQAYIQADLRGPATWVELPRIMWPEEWEHMRRPVVVLRKALYGHPNAGSYWEQECADRLCTIGWAPAGPEWSSVFWNATYRMLLVVYVDDFKMAGPKESHKRAWEEINQRITMSSPEGPGLYLGCKQTVGETQMADGTSVRTMTYDMSAFMGQCVETYLQLTGLDRSQLRRVSTPFLPEDQRESPARCVVRPGEPSIECEWCKHSMPVSATDVRGSPGAVREWHRVRPLISALTGVDPTGADGYSGDAHEQWIARRDSRRGIGADGEVDNDVGATAAPQGPMAVHAAAGILRVRGTDMETARGDGGADSCKGRGADATLCEPSAEPAGMTSAAAREPSAAPHAANLCNVPWITAQEGATEREPSTTRTMGADICDGTVGQSGADACSAGSPAHPGRPALGVLVAGGDVIGGLGEAGPSVSPRPRPLPGPSPVPAGGAPGPLEEMLDTETGQIVHGRKRQKKPRKVPTAPVAYEGDPDGPSEQVTTEQGGQLQGIAAKVLMKILYGARMARIDLLRAVCHLARYITRWDAVCDKRLHRLVSYINSTMDHKLVGWVGDGTLQLQPHLYADADFAGCVATQRSTSGGYLSIRGPHTCFPIAASSRRQGCVSKSTPEAEIVSMDSAVRSMGIPSLSLWDTMKLGKGGIEVHEDNMGMIRICETGRNPTMRYLARTHGVSVAWLHEQFCSGTFRLRYEVSERMAADVFTKAFTDSARWEAACWLVNVIHPDKLQEVIELGDKPPPQLGGGF